MRGVAAAALALAALGAGAQTIRLETMALAVKHRGGRFLALEPRSLLSVLDGGGRVVARLDLGRAVEGIRRYEPLDFALLADGRVAVAVYANYRLGASGAAVLLFDLSKSPPALEWRNLAPARCHGIEGAPEGGFWCLDQGGGGIALHYFDEHAGRELVLPERGLPAAGVWMGEVRMAAAAPGAVHVWLPSRRSLLRLHRGREKGRRWPLRLEGGGTAVTSFAVDAGGRVTALLPLRRGPERVEGLETRYGLFRLEADSGTWRRVRAGAEFPRGSTLAGAEEGAVWIWDRAARTITRTPAED
jgi:hypothetical protein